MKTGREGYNQFTEIAATAHELAQNAAKREAAHQKTFPGWETIDTTHAQAITIIPAE